MLAYLPLPLCSNSECEGICGNNERLPSRGFESPVIEGDLPAYLLQATQLSVTKQLRLCQARENLDFNTPDQRQVRLPRTCKTLGLFLPLCCLPSHGSEAYQLKRQRTPVPQTMHSHLGGARAAELTAVT